MINILSLKRQILCNDLRLLLFPKQSLTTQLSIAIEYGSNSDTDNKSGTAHFMEHMLAGGSLKRIKRTRNIESMGGCIEYSTSHEDTIIIADIVPDKIPEISKILSQQLLDSNFKEDYFESEQRIILNEIADASDDPWTNLEESLKRNLFATHPVRLPILGVRKTVMNLSLADIQEVHRTNYVPENLILILTGKFSKTDVNTLINDFSELNPGNPQSTIFPCNETNQKGKETTWEKTGITQTYLSIGAKTIPANHPDAPTLDVINTLIGGGTSSRLFIELRDKNALAYSINSDHECGLNYGYFHIDVAIKRKNLEKTIKLIQGEIEKINGEKITEKELMKGKDLILAGILRTIDNSRELPITLANLEMQFGSENAIVDYYTKVAEVTANDVMSAAKKYFTEQSLSSTIITPKVLRKPI